MRTQLNDSMPFAGLTIGQVTEMLEDLLVGERDKAHTYDAGNNRNRGSSPR